MFGVPLAVRVLGRGQPSQLVVHLLVLAGLLWKPDIQAASDGKWAARPGGRHQRQLRDSREQVPTLRWVRAVLHQVTGTGEGLTISDG